MIFYYPDINKTFESAFNKLKNDFECNYISYIYQCDKYKLAFVTHYEWMDLYINSDLNKSCSLIRVGLEKISLSKSKSVVLRWNDVQPTTKKERQVNGIRTEFNICNGISFGRKIFSASDYFGLAADIHNLDFPRKVIFSSKGIRKIMNDLFLASTVMFFYDSIINFYTIDPKLLHFVNFSTAQEKKRLLSCQRQ